MTTMKDLTAAATIRLAATLLAFPAAAASADGGEFVSETWGFAVERPGEGWAIVEEGGNATADFTLKIFPAGTKGEVIAQVQVKRAADADPARALADARGVISGKSEYSGEEVLEERLAGRAAPGIRVRYQSPQGEFRIEQVYLAEGGLRYVIQTHAPSREFSSRAQAFRKVKDSFRFVPLSGAAAAERDLRDLAGRCGSELEWASDWKSASNRAKREKKPVVVAVRSYPGFAISDELKTSTFMDPDVVALVRARFVPLRFSLSDDAPFKDQTNYGMSGTTFGQALLAVSPEGRVLLETPAVHPAAAYPFLLEALALDPELSGGPPPSGAPALERARCHADRGEFDRAEALLAKDPSSSARLLRATILRRQRRGEEALAEIALAREALGDGPSADADRAEAVIQLRLGRDEWARQALERVLAGVPDDPEALYLAGILDLRAKGADAARATWARLLERSPGSRWAWKAAADLSSTRLDLGMRIRTEWPAADVLASLRSVRKAPARRSEVARAEREAVDFLVRSQRADGSWVGLSVLESDGGQRPDALRDGVTAIAGASLLGRAGENGGARPAAERAIAFLLASREKARLAPDAPLFMDYTVWSDAFTLALLTDAIAARAGDEDRLRAAAAEIVGDLERKRKKSGGWSYYVSGDVTKGSTVADHSMSFVTAAVVLSLVGAKERGVAVPEAVLSGGLDLLERARRPDGPFEYMVFHGATRPPAGGGRAGAAGRGPVCELALLEGGRGTKERVRDALDVFVEEKDWLARELGKALMHAGPEGQGCHYLMFDYAFAARAQRETLRSGRGKTGDAILDLVLAARREDGSFLDTAILGPAYGTAMALVALKELGAAR